MMAAENYAELVARQRADVTNGLAPAVRRLRWPAERLAAKRERRLQESPTCPTASVSSASANRSW